MFSNLKNSVPLEWISQFPHSFAVRTHLLKPGKWEVIPWAAFLLLYNTDSSNKGTKLMVLISGGLSQCLRSEPLSRQ